MSTPSLAPFILKRPWLQRWMKPLSEWYLDNAGYRKLGLRYVSQYSSRIRQF
jgi:ubiquinol-cytochrome c reductase subunit 7